MPLGRIVLAMLVTALALPASALATDRHATTSTFASTFSAAQGGDTIYLAAGNYGSWSGGSKGSTVTIAPEPGAAVTMGVNFGSNASYLQLQGLTIPGVQLNGSHDVAIVGSAVTGMSLVLASLNNANILFDGDSFDAISACGTCYEGRLTVRGYDNTAPVGVKITNTHFGNGGCSDGVQIIGNAYGVQVGPGNEFGGLHQGSCAAHVDSIQLYGSSHTQIVGNYFHDSDTDIMAPDGGDHEVISDNVFVGAGYRPAIQLGTHDTTTFAHNTVRSVDVYMDAKTGSPSSTNGVLRDNVVVDGTLNAPSTKCSSCTVSYNLFNASGNASGTNTVIGTPVFTGGSSPTTYSGYALASGSPGKANASDGTDRGIRTAGAPADTTPPDTSISSGPATTTTSTSVSFGFTSTEAGSTFQCKLDSGTYAACTSPKGYSGLSVGSHTFSVRATDGAANTDASPATQSWTINAPADTTPPETTISSGPNGATRDTTPTFAFTSSEPGSTFACRVDSGAWSSCTSPWTTAELADGGHSVSVRATDGAGNTDASPAARSFTIHTAAPHTKITSSPTALSLSGGGSVAFTVDETDATSECRLDDGAWAGCTSPYEVSGLGTGGHTVQVRSTDAVGNVEAPAQSASWTVVAPVTPTPTPNPTVPAGPTVTLVAPKADATVTSSIRFRANATASNGMKRVDFWVDGRRVATDSRAPYASQVTVSGLHSGTHTVTARAFDTAGQAASSAVLVRVSRKGTRAKAAVLSAARGAQLTTAAAGDDATRLAGAAPKQRMVRATLTLCDDRKGAVADRASLRADSQGRLDAMRSQAGLCVLKLALAS